jgi:hypothetical protein
MVSLQEMGVAVLEANPEEIESEVENKEERKEEAAMETIRAVEDRYGERHLGVGQPPTDEGTDPGRRWVPKHLGRRQQTDTLLAFSALRKRCSYKGPALHSRYFTSGERTTNTHRTRYYIGLEGLEPRTRRPRPSSQWPVALQNELSQILC